MEEEEMKEEEEKTMALNHPAKGDSLRSRGQTPFPSEPLLLGLLFPYFCAFLLAAYPFGEKKSEQKAQKLMPGSKRNPPKKKPNTL